MKKLIDVFAYLIVALNAVWLAFWIYSFNRYDTHDERVAYFRAHLPLTETISAIVLILLSVFSLIVLAKKQLVFPKMLALVQVFFIILYIWGIL